MQCTPAKTAAWTDCCAARRPGHSRPIRGSRTREVWWADLGEPDGSEPGSRRPVVTVQSDAFNRSRLRTVLGVVLMTNLRLLGAPGNVLIPAKAAGLPKDSVASVSQLITIDRDFLLERAGRLRGQPMRELATGLRLVLDL